MPDGDSKRGMELPQGGLNEIHPHAGGDDDNFHLFILGDHIYDGMVKGGDMK